MDFLRHGLKRIIRFGFCVCLCWAQAAQDQPAVIRSTTRLVQVNVVVNDQKLNPLGDLKQEDFEIFDNGVPQQIRFFAVEKGEAGRTARPALPPGVVSNDWQRGVTHDTITVILLDPANTSFSDLAFARQQLVRFLAQIRPTDRVAVYLLGHNLRILQDFTNNPALLVRRISTYRIPLLDIGPPVVQSAQVPWTLMALEAIAYHLAGLPGRKNLIWLSAAFPLVEAPGSMESASWSSELHRVALILNQADIAVYPVDARGLMARLPQNDTGFFTMMQVARDTGGRAFFNSNDVQGAIRTVVDSTRVSYAIGFYPSSSLADNKFHTLSVRVKQPGLSTHYRRGYFDTPGEPRPEPSIRAVLANHLEATGLGVMARARPAGNGKLSVDVQVEPGSISTQERNGKRVAVLDFALAPMDDHGLSYPGALDPFTLRLDKTGLKLLLRSGARYHRVMNVDSRASMLRVVVRDRMNGAMGSVTIPLKHKQT